jgi:cysteate synthase
MARAAETHALAISKQSGPTCGPRASSRRWKRLPKVDRLSYLHAVPSGSEIHEIRARTFAYDREYSLVCSLCGARQDDDGLVLGCSKPHGPALIASEYFDTEFRVDDRAEGLFRYRNWLPVIRTFPSRARTAVFRSERLGRKLGLNELWIAFNGYWPERGAFFETASFKDLEAMAVLGRMPRPHHRFVVASSGNTAAAFAAACSLHGAECVIVIPERALDRLRQRVPLSPWVHVIVLEQAEYAETIAFAASLAGPGGICPEGGVANVGRRDGLATVMYSAFEAMGRLPDYYFQAVGSGTGAIAAFEAARRLRAAGGGSAVLPRLMLSQNAPFTPIYDLWKSRMAQPKDMTPPPAEIERRYDSAEMVAYDLANPLPPFDHAGGVHDVLLQSRGDVMTADNDSVEAAMNSFLELESIDIGPAAATAVACLRNAAISGRIPRDSAVLLNITGGGRRRLEMDHSLIQVEPALRFSRHDVLSGRAIEQVAEMGLGR